MEFRVLGPVEVLDGERPLPLGGPAQRAVLALLLVHAGEVLSIQQVVDELWGDAPPATARAVVHSYVSRLRTLLRPVERQSHAALLVTAPAGYSLRFEAERLDLCRFERLCAAARRAAAQGRVTEAADGLGAALALWRGPALAGIGPDRLRATADRLEEQRVTALEQRIALDLRLGRHRELVGELEALVAAYPFREGFVGQLMLALWRSGRQVEALAVYQAVRRRLVSELGVEPGAALQQIQREILTADSVSPVGSRPAPPADAREPAVRAPCQLPPDLADFTGRRAALRQARDLIEGSGDPVAPAVTVITGPAGVGKTTVAVRLAHHLRPRFPDGQLFVNLRGAEAQALDPAEVLGRFLGALGVDRGALPQGLDDRVGLYRSLLADRRVLVLLDNAAGAGQIRALLPSGPGCAAVATSRIRLDGLEGARTLRLDVLQAGEALGLLAKIAGEQRVAAEPTAAREIVACCGGLPLAVRIAAVRLAARPDRRLQALAGLLGDERRRLHELRVGDLEVRASIALSYQSETARTRRAFRLLGLVQAATFPAWTASVLLDHVPADAAELADGLVDAGLLQSAGEDVAGQPRYRFHDLVRALARERLDEEEPPEMREAALVRFVRAYVERAGAAEPPWFAAERASLVTLTAQAHAAGLWELTWQLALAASEFFEAHSHWDDWRRTHELALDASRQARDRPAEAAVLRRLGDLHLDRSELAKANPCFTACLAIFRELGDRHGQARALAGLGDTHRERGEVAEALACLSDCLPILRDVDDRRGVAEALRSLGILHRQQGRLDEAITPLEECVRISRELGDPRWDAIARRSLGMLYRDQGRLDEARSCFEACLAILRALDDRLWQAYTLISLGRTRAEQGALEDARMLHAESVTIFRQLHDRCGEGWALQALGDVHRDQGRLDDARAALEQSLALFGRLGNETGEAYALQALGDVLRDQGRPADARRQLQQAVRMARRLGAHACQTRAQASLDAISAG